MKGEYPIAEAQANSISIGYEINRIAVLLNIIWALNEGREVFFITGIVFAVLSYTAAYFGESRRSWGLSYSAYSNTTAGLAVASYLFWLFGATGG